MPASVVLLFTFKSLVNHGQVHQGLTRSANVNCFCTSHKTSHMRGT